MLSLIDKSYNVHEMCMLLESVYKGPSPQIFSSYLRNHIVYVLDGDLDRSRIFIKEIFSKVKDLNLFEIKKLKLY
jgi:hypothetical protein